MKLNIKIATIFAVLLLITTASFAREDTQNVSPRPRPNIMQSATDVKTHDVGQLYFTISNYGFFGSQRGEDNPRYCIIYQEGDNAGKCRPSAEYPGGTGLEYLFQGALWIGAVVNGDTLVSVGEDGWFTNVNEIFPGYNQATDTIMVKSILYGDPGAISEQDFIAEMTDTVKNPDYVDPTHRPIGIKTIQRSVAWSYNYARNFIIIDYWFVNINREMTIEDAYIGIYIDGDVGHINKNDYAQDDVTGFVTKFINNRGDTINVNTAWLADNDGDPSGDGRFDNYSVTGALGVAVLKVGDIPLEELRYSFNWWVSNTNEDNDWGPYLRRNDWGWDGTPETDKMKYQVMSNGEFDYDQSQIESYMTDPDWVAPPSALAARLKGGYDTRFLFSFGPFSIEPNETVQVAIAVMVAENFHTDPRNVGMPPGGSVPSSWDPSKFNYEGVGSSTEWVRIIYENNYRGPVPPPRPPFFTETENNKIYIYWNPDTCVNYLDEITGLVDFEGFRIYVSDANIESYYTPIVEFDKVDFVDYDLDSLETNNRVLCLDARRDRNGVIHDEILYPNLCLDTVIIGGSSIIFQRKKYGTNTGLPKDSVFIGGKKYYRYTLTHQRAGADMYIALTAYDFGQPTRRLESLESSKTTNFLWVVPKGAQETSREVYVVPNPYRIDDNYAGRDGLNWETPVGKVWTEYSRKIRFANLPAKCIIRIYTLDGDLVDEMDHEDPTSAGTIGKMVGAEDWDLINRNDQAISSGIYLFSVEDKQTGEYHLGKFVIIK